MATFNNRGLRAVGSATTVATISSTSSPGNLIYTASTDLTHVYTVIVFVSSSAGTIYLNVTDSNNGAVITDALFNLPLQLSGRSVMPNGSMGNLTIDFSLQTSVVKSQCLLLYPGDKMYFKKAIGGNQTVTYYAIQYFGVE